MFVKNIWNVHWEKGDWNRAKQYYSEAHNIYLMSLGADHPSTRELVAYSYPNGSIEHCCCSCKHGQCIFGQQDLTISRCRKAHSIFLLQIGPNLNQPYTNQAAKNMSRFVQRKYPFSVAQCPG